MAACDGYNTMASITNRLTMVTVEWIFFFKDPEVRNSIVYYPIPYFILRYANVY